MTKEELSACQRVTRELFVAKLRQVGWSSNGWEEMFESGINVNPEALATYTNRAVDLQLGWFAGEDFVRMEMNARDGNRAMTFRLHPGCRLGELLDAVANVQDAISFDNYVPWIKGVLPLCSQAALETPDGLVSLS